MSKVVQILAAPYTLEPDTRCWITMFPFVLPIILVVVVNTLYTENRIENPHTNVLLVGMIPVVATNDGTPVPPF
jgi:hypothetical protein